MPYNCQTEETDISYPETVNSLAKIPINKSANKKISTLLDYLEPQRSQQRGRPWKSHFINNFTNQTITIFIGHGE